MELSTLAASFLGGGLSGGCVNVWFNRQSRHRDLRTKLYPKLNDIHSAYLIRMEKPEGRYWVTIVGNNPSDADEEFVNHRSTFISDLIQFNQLREARALRKRIIENSLNGHHTPGLLTKLDLTPEARALNDCLKILHKKLRLD